MSSRTRAVRRAGLALAAALLLVATAVAPAEAGTFRTMWKWKNCDTHQSSIGVKATFTDPARYYGAGRYMVKKEIRWDYYKGAGQWRNADHWRTETAWLQINNPSYDFVTSIGDKTNWGALYDENWRAHVTFKLIKNRPGPRDKKVEVVEIWPAKGSFAEKGSCTWWGGM